MAGTNNPDGFDKLLNVMLPKTPIQLGKSTIGEPRKKARFNIDNPRYDQSSFFGRYKHFAQIVNPKNLLKTDSELYRAKEIVNKFRQGDDLLGMTDDEIWEQKAIMDSAFHPETGDKQNIAGRLGALLPIDLLFTGGMTLCYKSTPAQILLLWANQTFRAVYNYSSQSGASSVSLSQIGLAYVCATVAGVGSALGLKHMFRNANPFSAKFAPFMAVSVANTTNIAIVRFGELSNGTSIFTADSKDIGQSKIAARQGLSQVIISRIAMACPTSVILPIAIQFLTSSSAFKSQPKILFPLRLGIFGTMVIYATPVGCCLYPQIHPISPSNLEPELQEKMKKLPGPPMTVFYNKGQ